MLFTIIILALSVSIDAFGIGVTYGIRNTYVPISAKLILFIISFLFASFSIFIGNMLFSILNENIIKIISVLLLVGMGTWIIYEAFQENNEKKEKNKHNNIYQIFLKPFGITIQIIKNPISSDLNNSKIIEKNEAIYLAIALSIDSICVGISSSSFGIYSLLFPLLVPIFQFIFLNCGILFGEKLTSYSKKTTPKIWSFLSGILLIIIGLSRIII